MAPKVIPTPDDWRAGYQPEWEAFLKWLFISAGILLLAPILGFLMQSLPPDWVILAFLPIPFCLASLAIAVRGWLRLARKQVMIANTLEVSRGRGRLIKFINERPVLGGMIIVAMVLVVVFIFTVR